MPSSKGYICVQCNNKYTLRPHTNPERAKYCSKVCKDTHRSTTAFQYSKLNDDETPRSYLRQLKAQKGRKELNLDDLVALWEKQDGKCAITGEPMTHKRKLGTRHTTNGSIDRIDPKGKYVLSNIRLVCAIVNKMRLDMTDDELKDWCELILKGTNNAK